MSSGQQIIPVRPTVFVGLGGTGKEILLRLRMKFFERYSVHGYPCISYVWVDTDMQNLNVDRKEMDPIFQRVLFSQSEQVDIQIPDPSDFLNNPGKHPNILEWMPPAISQTGLRIQDGAGQIRAKGRFSFFWKFQEVREKIRRAIIKVSNPQARADTAKFSSDKNLNLLLDEDWGPRVNFFIAGSLAGGTGSGIFLDTAFLIRYLASLSSFKPDITGLLFLASLFTNDTHDRRFANCYAALKELEYYNFTPVPGARGIEDEKKEEVIALRKFTEKWIEDAPNKPVNGPPFNTCYLLDGYTYGGTPVTPDHKYEVFDMVAEYLFWEFYRGEFASQKRSIRPNNRQYLDRNHHETYDQDGESFHTQRLSTGYSSFGLSWLSVPIGGRIGACAYRLAEEILEYWERGGVISREGAQEALRRKNMVEAMRKAVESEALALGGKNLIEELAKTGQGTKFSEVLKTGIQPYFQENNQEASVYDNLARFEEQFLHRKRGSIIYDHIEPGRNVVLARYKEKVRAWVTRMLQEEGFIPLLGFTYREQDGSLKKVDGYLDILLEVMLKDIHREIQEYKDIFTEEKFASEGRKNKFISNTDELDSHFVLYKEFSRRVLLHKCKETEIEYAEAYVGEWVCEESLLVLSGIREYIDKDIKNVLLGFYNGVLSPLIGDFKDMRDRYSKEDSRTLSIFLYEDLDKYYRLSGNPVDVKQEKDLLFSGKVSGLWEVITQWTKDKLKEQVESYSLVRFQNDFQSRFAAGTGDEPLANAVKLFNEKYPPSDLVNRSNAIRIFLGGGQPYVRPNQVFGPRIPQPQRDNFLGLSGVTPPSQPGQGFIQELRGNYGLSLAQPIETEKESILYYHELTGLPLFYLSTLTQYKISYDEFQGKVGDLPCHTHRRAERFSEISLLEPEEAKNMLKVWEIVILGTILRTLQVEPSLEEFRYFYYKGHAAEVEILGDEKGTIRALSNNLQKFSWCSQEIDRRKKELCKDPSGMKIYYGILHAYREEIFPSEMAVLPSGENTYIASFQSSVLGKLIREAEGMSGNGHLPSRVPNVYSPEWEALLNLAKDNSLCWEIDKGGKRDRRYCVKSMDVFVKK